MDNSIIKHGREKSFSYLVMLKISACKKPRTKRNNVFTINSSTHFEEEYIYFFVLLLIQYFCRTCVFGCNIVVFVEKETFLCTYLLYTLLPPTTCTNLLFPFKHSHKSRFTELNLNIKMSTGIGNHILKQIMIF